MIHLSLKTSAVESECGVAVRGASRRQSALMGHGGLVGRRLVPFEMLVYYHLALTCDVEVSGQQEDE